MGRRRSKAADPDLPPLTPEQQEARDAAWRDYLSLLAEALWLATRSLGGITGRVLSGHLPHLGDEQPPWTVRGWLLPHVMDLLPGVGGMPGRWRYWLETMRAGKLLEQPIPQLEFGDGSADGRREVSRAAERIGSGMGYGSAPYLLVEWLAWALNVAEEPPRLQPEVEEILYRTLSLDPLLRHPADYLGWLMCEYKGRGYDPSGFFPTPLCLGVMMAGLLYGGGAGEDHRASKVCDPCVGTGRLLLAASNHSLRLYGQDINRTCVLATFVNGALYAPWLAFPFPEVIFGEHFPGPPAEAWEELPVVAAGSAVFDPSGQGVLFGP